MKKLLGIVVLSFILSNTSSATPPKNKWSPSLEKWKKIFKKVEYPPNDCKYCTERHDYWAYDTYRKSSLENRNHKNNGGLKKIIIKPAKSNPVRIIKKNIKPLPKEIYDYVYYRDISSLMVFDKGVLIHDWKRDYIFNDKPIDGQSRSKSIVGIAAIKMACQNILDLNKTHAEYSSEIKDSFYGHVTLKDSLNMLARDQYVMNYNILKETHRKKSDLVSILNRHPKRLETEGPKEFKYSNPNTDLITLDMINILGGKKKFAKWFQKNISEAAGFASKGKILLDKKGAPISSSSIMLTREDWLRFGMYVIELMEDKNSCEAKKLQEAFENAVPTKKKFAPKYAMFFWLNGYGIDNLVQMRGYGLRLSLIDWKNDRIIQTNSFAISWKPQELVNLIWK
jgi:CubicO group peptidase (beta-lactamase class C family)